MTVPPHPNPSRLPFGFDMLPFTPRIDVIASPNCRVSLPFYPAQAIKTPGREAGNRASPGGRISLPARSSRSVSPSSRIDPFWYGFGRVFGFLLTGVVIIPINAVRQVVREYRSLFRAVLGRGRPV